LKVFDASVFVDALVVASPPGDAAREALRDQNILQAPAIFPAEVASGLTSMVAAGELPEPRAKGALEQLRVVRADLYPFMPFITRVWELKENLTVYDAWYVALAERLDCSFLTADERLASAPGPRCPVEYVRAS
jgi:predicted nucleic acid-binding protein